VEVEAYIMLYICVSISVPDMTCSVFGGTLNLTQSVSLAKLHIIQQ